MHIVFESTRCIHALKKKTSLESSETKLTVLKMSELKEDPLKGLRFRQRLEYRKSFLPRHLQDLRHHS